jgi:signal transduction histidine kinase
VDKQIVIQVQDTGCGIPEEDLSMIFKKPFYQGNGKNSLEKSTGVGLVLVSQYAKSLKGDVKVKSQSGQGTIFTVYLPAMEEAHRAA